MQIQKANTKQKGQKEENQVALFPSSSVWRQKAPSCIYPAISINHICNIEDAFFINQKSLRDPEHEDQSFLRTIFYFKFVGSASVTQNYITLHLKKRDQSYLPKEYFIERFKSFGNREFYEIAVHLEHIAQHLKEIKEIRTKEVQENFSKQNEEKILQESLSKVEKKKFFSFFYEFTQQGSNLNQIIISKALLSALGYDYQDIAIDFLKYQQAIFEIISAKLYCLVMERKSQLLDSVFEKMKQHVMSPEEVKELTMFRFNDDLLPKSNNAEIDYERKIRARIKFLKTHPSVTIFEIQKMNRKGKIFEAPKNKMEEEKLSFYKTSVREQEYECVKNLLKVSENCLEENKKKMSSYRLIKEEPIKKNSKRKIVESSSDSEYLGFD